jgi:hypothetical protein
MNSATIDPADVIRELNAAGKDPRGIAMELVERGIKPRGKAVWSADIIESILRFLGLTTIRNLVISTPGGKKSAPASLVTAFEGKPERRQKASKPTHTFSTLLTDEQKELVTRLYKAEGLKADAIAKQLKLPYRRVTAYCAHLSGLEIPPGEFTEFIDEQGRKVTKCPPAYARGIFPQRNVGAY